MSQEIDTLIRTTSSTPSPLGGGRSTSFLDSRSSWTDQPPSEVNHKRRLSGRALWSYRERAGSKCATSTPRTTPHLPIETRKSEHRPHRVALTSPVNELRLRRTAVPAGGKTAASQEWLVSALEEEGKYIARQRNLDEKGKFARPGSARFERRLQLVTPEMVELMDVGRTKWCRMAAALVRSRGTTTQTPPSWRNMQRQAVPLIAPRPLVARAWRTGSSLDSGVASSQGAQVTVEARRLAHRRARGITGSESGHLPLTSSTANQSTCYQRKPSSVRARR